MMEMMATVTITSSILILAVLLLRQFCKGKIRQRLWYAVWLLVAAKLLMAPFTAGISSPISVMNLFDGARLQSILEPEENRVDVSEGQTLSDIGKSACPGVENPDVKGAQRIETDQKAGTNGSLTDMLRLVWYVGMGITGVGIAGYNLVYYLSLRKRRILYDTVYDEISCYLVEGIPSPCLFGKSIYLPVYVVRDKKLLSHVLAHEYAHYRQRDLLWGIVRCICLAIYWYHPLVWLAAYVSRQDSELACDEIAIAMLGEKERIAYGKSLLALVREGQKMMECIGCASAMSGNGRRLKERMMRITGKTNTRITTLLLLAVAMVLLAGCTFTDKSETAQKPEAGTEHETVQELKTQPESESANVKPGTENPTLAAAGDTASTATEQPETKLQELEQEREALEEAGQQIEEERQRIEEEIRQLKEENGMAEASDAGDTAVPVNAVGIVKEGTLFVRETPKEDADAVNLLEEGQELTVLVEVGDFYQISISTEEGTFEGYVKKEYIDLK